VKNLSIKSKLVIGLLLMASLPIVTLALAGYGLAQYRSVVDTAGEADEIQKLLNKEHNGILQFLSGDQNGGDKYADAHREFLEIKERLELSSPNGGGHIRSIIAGEQEINDMLFGAGNGFFLEFSEAQQGLIDRNSKHINRLLGYRDNWVSPRGADSTEILEILDKIRDERIIIEDFNPRYAGVGAVKENFRNTNDGVVEKVSRLWQQELDLGIARSSSPALRAKLQAVKRIVGQITATSFPPISYEDARLLGIPQIDEAVFGSKAESATKIMTNVYEASVNDYEKDGGVPLWTRADVIDVGEGVTSAHVLSAVVSCQQGLRVAGEDIFKWMTAYTNDIEPGFTAIDGELDMYLGALATSVTGRADRAQLISVIATAAALVFALLLIILLSRVIVKPISLMRDIAVELSRGDFSRRAQVNSRDEIGTLANAFNQMIDHLQKSIDDRDREIAERKKVEEALRDANDRLEIRVEERTTDLITANQHLIREISRHQFTPETQRTNPQPAEDI